MSDGDTMLHAYILPLIALLSPASLAGLTAALPSPTRIPIVRTSDLNVGESQEVELAGGKKVTVKLLDLKETRDELRQRRSQGGSDGRGERQEGRRSSPPTTGCR